MGDSPGNNLDTEKLLSVNLENFYQATTESQRIDTIRQFLEFRGVISSDYSSERLLYDALSDYGPMKLLIKLTMDQAQPIGQLSSRIFPSVPSAKASLALTVLMALGSVSRKDSNTPSLLPCRIHNFFRGLPGLWICMDPSCSTRDEELEDGICGKMYGQPREICECGARVLELYTCRNCGTAYARAYTDNAKDPSTLWAEPGHYLRMSSTETKPLSAIDLLLEDPTDEDLVEIVEYDLETGHINPPTPGPRMRNVFIRSEAIADSVDDGEDERDNGEVSCAQFLMCAVCRKKGNFGQSYVRDHQTKGDQPFQALVSRQIQIQPPGRVKSTNFAPLQGRKVLIFSDSRQVAARLAPNLQLYTDRDSLRSLVVWGYKRLQDMPQFERFLSLEDLYLAVLLASKKLKVRLRPEVKFGETFDADRIVSEAFENGALENESSLFSLCMRLRSARPPESLLDNIVTTVRDRFLGLEALALASIVECTEVRNQLVELPSISGLIETDEQKIGLTRAWIRCWQNRGFWLNSMPPVWWQRPRTQGISISGQKGKFNAMTNVLQCKEDQKVFWKEWSPKLLSIFTEDMGEGYKRLRGGQLSLMFGDNWVHCEKCKSVHRPIPSFTHCIDCGANIREMNPDTDLIFLARKGFYRKAVTEALSSPPRQPMALIAAEHTGQLNAPQSEDLFSKAEENELLFQDIQVSMDGNRQTAIDVLSSTTTMEVGIDIGALSGVALRNMPPGRANYQQRSGRAGRRGSGVATIVAFGSSDSHDEHFFSNPDGMIRGEVVDPKLTLDNVDIIRRHICAFLLQNYHQDRITENNPNVRNDLFSVLGTVSEFRTGAGVLNRDNFALWLGENEDALKIRINSWIPEELADEQRYVLLQGMKDDCLREIDRAIQFNSDESETEENDSEEWVVSEDRPELGEEQVQENWKSGNLLDRLLYCGVLPRYAFPTDVATFHIFDSASSQSFRPKLRFSPSQSLPVALTQYAPGKQVWVSGKCYTSGAIYSSIRDDRRDAWSAKRIYMECRECGIARTYEMTEVDRGEIRDCVACGGEMTFGPGRYWFRPPGFAHPIDFEEVTSPDDIPETSYATRAKLTMGTPDDSAGWKSINERVRVLPIRQHLLVSNTGPQNDGYVYCTSCGKIESSHEREPKLQEIHRKPYPEVRNKSNCLNTNPTRNVVLGSDFITDIALFSIRVESPLSLRPGNSSTNVVLRTVSEALSQAACQRLEVEGGELMAEFRPALTPDGKKGTEAEIFLYDTLAGGAGFSRLVADFEQELLIDALRVLQSCPEGCDTSCYRCLRSYKNKFEHSLLDRHAGAELLEYLLTGSIPGFDQKRLNRSTLLLYRDLSRQNMSIMSLELEVNLEREMSGLVAPILVKTSDGREYIVALSSPLTSNYPADPLVRDYRNKNGKIQVIVENELIVRGNLPAATNNVRSEIGV